MSGKEYEYLRQLPLVLHLPSMHTFVVHAGILSHDPRYPVRSTRQPLAHIPKNVDVTPPEPAPKPHPHANDPQVPFFDSALGTPVAIGRSKSKVERLRKAQELSVLADVPQNADPWVLLNLRGVTDDNEVTRCV